MTDRTCLLCGAAGDVAVALVAWLEPDPLHGKMFDSIPRCRDRQACRARVEALPTDNVWLVRDNTVPTVRRVSA